MKSQRFKKLNTIITESSTALPLLSDNNLVYISTLLCGGVSPQYLQVLRLQGDLSGQQCFEHDGWFVSY